MTARRRLVAGLVFLCVFALAVFVGWRAFPAAATGEVLVLRGRAVAGPLRLVAAPWAPRRVLPANDRASVELPLQLGQGSSWPLRLTVTTRIDPQALDQRGRETLLAGPTPAAMVQSRAPRALDDAVRGLSARAILARPAALEAPVAAALEAGLPRGVFADRVEVAVQAPPEQARAAALGAARSMLTPPVARVLYIGIDGADWDIADQFIAEGALPNLARLTREGVRANLVSYNPMISPMLWTTALTGRAPDEHGIADFTLSVGDKPDPEDEGIPITSRFRKTPALWEILAAAGQKSGFVGYWATQPTEQVPGVLVSDLGPKVLLRAGRDIPARIAWPPEFLPGLRSETYTVESVPPAVVRAYAPDLSTAEIDRGRRFFLDPALKERWQAENKDKKEGRRTPIEAFLVNIAALSHNLEVIGRRLAADPDLGVVSIYFEDIDLCGHNFQHLASPPHPLASPGERRFSGAVKTCYQLQDAAIGRLVAAAGPETVVLIHSDHGFQWGARRPVEIAPYTKGQPVEWHRLQGLFLVSGGPVRKGIRVPDVTLYDIAPTILALRGVPPGENMPGRVRVDLFENAVADRLPRERVPSWDPLVSPRTYEDASEEDLRQARADALEQLKGLGYVGDVDEPEEAPPTDATASAAPLEGQERPRVMYYRNLATWYMNEDRYEDAEHALKEANNLRPLPKSYHLLAESRALRGDVAGALAALDEGFEKFPEKMEPETALWVVELKLRAGDLSGAERELTRRRQLLAGAPAVAATAEGLLAESRRDGATARARYLAALQADPRSVRAAERLAALAQTPAERAALEPFLRLGLAQDQRIAPYWRMLGLLAVDRGDHLTAAQSFQRAYELQPGADEVGLSEAIAWARAGRPAEARFVYEQLARRGSRLPQVWVNLGSMRAQGADWRGAAAAWEQAQKLGADTPELRAALEQARSKIR